ncbi:MAG: hypothetical protein ABFS45_21570, partial [Pseudomonadota bacterium]
TWKPYFISGHHCFDNQSTVSTLETWWFYQSETCDGSGTDVRFEKRHGGAQLLYKAEVTDTAFLLLNSSPPSGVWFLGWWAVLPDIGEPVSGIHHPQADKKKISFGSNLDYAVCSDGETDGTFRCVPSNAGQATYLVVNWDSGITESGSSGSGLFAHHEANDDWPIVGTLRGGNDSCSDPSGVSFYGRFDIPYSDALHEWLNPSMSERFSLAVSKTGTGTGTITSSPNGISCGGDCAEAFNSGIIVSLAVTPNAGSYFTGWSGACSGIAPCVVSMTSNKSVTARFDTPGTALNTFLQQLFGSLLHALNSQ